jgi:microsomal prostaglandin-E synthase 2
MMASSLFAANRCILARSSPAIAPLSKHLGWTSRLFSASASDGTAPPAITLYQYSICPFCNIVKSVLSYADVKHDIVEVNPLTKSEIKWCELKN